MRIAVVGAGYVGLVSGACFADFGHEVTCIDSDAGKVERLGAGIVPIYEPGLEDLVESNVAAGRLSFTTDLKAGVAGAACVFIAVGTPSRRGDGHADLSYVHAAASEVADALEDAAVVVVKSTVPVGTGDDVERIVRQRRPDLRIAVASNPEFLREGAAIGDFKRPDRIVLGTDDPDALAVLKEVYRPLYLNQAPILVTGRRSAELIKYAANAFLATKITFINEMADLCEKVGADVQDVARGIGLDNRIGPKFLHPGPGFGGSCFPKDIKALVRTAEDHGAPVRIVETVMAVNETRKDAMAAKVVAACGGSVAGKRIAVLGLTFKQNTDDMRDAPSIAIVSALVRHGAEVTAYDPQGMEVARPLLPPIAYATDPYSCAKGADALVIVTEWEMFRALNLGRIRSAMATPVVVDLRNIYRPDAMRGFGFTYVSVGQRGSPAPTVPSPGPARIRTVSAA